MLIDVGHGLGGGARRWAHRAAGTGGPGSTRIRDGAVAEHPEGAEAVRLDRTGMLGLTDARLPFLPDRRTVNAMSAP
jgi:hypothetical protein